MKYFKRNTFLVLVSLLIGVLIFVWLGRIIGWQNILQAFQAFQVWQAIVIVALSFLIAVLGNWRWFAILKYKQVNVPFWKLFRIYLGGYAMMYLFPIIVLSGEIFRAVMIVKEEKDSMPKAAASVIIERVLEWTINIIVILFAILYLIFKAQILPPQIVYVFGAALVFFIILIGYFYFKALRQKSIISGIVKRFSNKQLNEGSNLIEIENEILRYFQPGNALWIGFLLSALRAVAMLTRVWLLILFLTSINIGFVAALAVLGFSYFSSLIPIPTSLGSHEVIQAAAFGSFGLQASMATAFTMIIRAGEVIVSIFGLVFLIKKGFNIM